MRINPVRYLLSSILGTHFHIALLRRNISVVTRFLHPYIWQCGMELDATLQKRKELKYAP